MFLPPELVTYLWGTFWVQGYGKYKTSYLTTWHLLCGQTNKICMHGVIILQASVMGTICMMGVETEEGEISLLVGQGSFQKSWDYRRAMKVICGLDGRRGRPF